MKYEFEYTVRYQDVDDTRRLRLVALEEYLLDVAGRVANQLGFGIEYLKPQNMTWILTRLSLEMDYLPTHGEVLVFETWIEANIHMLSIRDFRIYVREADGQKRQIGQCQSVWAVLELTKREVQNIFDQPVFATCVNGTKLTLARAPRLMPITEPQGVIARRIVYSDLDYNRHCNSCRYLQMLLDAVHPDAGCMAADHHLRLDITYAKEVLFGDMTQIRYLHQDNLYQYQLLDPSGATSCTARIEITA